MPQIELLNGIHKNHRIVRILFPFNQKIINKLKQSTTAQWSASMKCWYINKALFNLNGFFTAINGVAYIDYSALKKYLQGFTPIITKKPLAKIKSPLDTILSVKQLILNELQKNLVSPQKLAVIYQQCLLNFD